MKDLTVWYRAGRKHAEDESPNEKSMRVITWGGLKVRHGSPLGKLE